MLIARSERREDVWHPQYTVTRTVSIKHLLHITSRGHGSRSHSTTTPTRQYDILSSSATCNPSITSATTYNKHTCPEVPDPFSPPRPAPAPTPTPTLAVARLGPSGFHREYTGGGSPPASSSSSGEKGGAAGVGAGAPGAGGGEAGARGGSSEVYVEFVGAACGGGEGRAARRTSCEGRVRSSKAERGESGGGGGVDGVAVGGRMEEEVVVVMAVEGGGAVDGGASVEVVIVGGMVVRRTVVDEEE